MSWYKYRARPRKRGTERYTGDISFRAFIDGLTPAEFAEIVDRGFITDAATGRMVDCIFRYEEFDKFVAFLRALYGDDFTLGEDNVSPDVEVDFEREKPHFEKRFAPDIAWYESLKTMP